MANDKLIKAIKEKDYANIRGALANGLSSINEADESENTPLTTAIACNDDHIVALLLSHGSDPLYKNSEGYDCIWLSEESSSGLNIKLALAKAVAKKWGIDVTDELSQTRLAMLLESHLLIESDKLKAKGKNPQHDQACSSIIRLINFIDPYYLHGQLVAAIETNNEARLSHLLDAGVNVNCQDDEKATALFFAVDQSRINMVSLLLKYGAWTHGKQVEDQEGMLPIFHAFQSGNDTARLSIAKLLLDSDSRLANQANSYGETPLHCAAKRGCIEGIKLLLKHKANINAVDENHETALHLAASNPPIAKLLIEHGADPSVRNSTAQTPADIARQIGFIDLSKALKKCADAKTIRRQRHAQSKFFDPSRSKSAITASLQAAFYSMRTRTQGNSPSIKTDHTPRRRLITADSGAVRQSLDSLSPEDRTSLTTTDKISAKLRWFRKSKINWNREAILLGMTDVKSQYIPQPGHLGNFHMKGIGDYGTGLNNRYSNILEIINDVTRVVPADINKQHQNEKTLARLLLEHSRTGMPITQSILRENGFQLYKRKSDSNQQTKYLNRLCYLISAKEISRRMHPGIRGDGSTVQELPFALTYYRGLKLIEAGHLNMQSLFDKNAHFNPVTYNNVTSSINIDRAKLIIARLNELYETKLFPSGGTFSTESYHQELLRSFGGASDTSGDEYSSGPESESERKLDI
jgi:ankyrin repeat protein